jgi:hypothetical protein
MRGSKRRGRRGGRYALAGLIATLAVTAFAAGPAQAETDDFSATFDDAALNVGGLGFDILDTPSEATMDGTFDDVANTFNVPTDAFVVPEFEGDPLAGVHVIVNFRATAPVTGGLNPTTGGLTTVPSTYQADVDVNGNPCQYPATMTFTTNDTGGAPYQGDPFAVTTTDGTPDLVTIASGVMQTSWSSLTPDPDEGCELVNSLITSPGGLAFGNGFDLTPETSGGGGSNPAPTPVTTTSKKKKKCKKKKGKKSSANSAAKKCKKKKK